MCGLPIQATQVAAQANAPSWATEGPKVDAPSFSLELPLEVVGTKLYVEVELGGTPRRFVFDTGSPSMLDSALAEELGPEVVGKSQGRDAHGALIESQIVQMDLTLGEVVFRKVPMFAADFSRSAPAKCLVGDGVLGSELLPLCAWQIDLVDSVLRCHTNLGALDHVERAEKVRLHDFGYPHIPYLDIQLARKAESKAMFDTGAPTYLTISPPDLEGARKAGGIGRMVEGYGSAGASLGGQAPMGDQAKAEVKALSIGSVALGRVEAMVREAPPSLLGAKLLEHFVVTLDARSGYAYFDEYRGGPFVQPSFGFGLSFADGIAVSLVWEDSPAAAAGVQVGQVLTSIQGRPADATCESMRNALRALSGESIELVWEGGGATLTGESSARQQ